MIKEINLDNINDFDELFNDFISKEVVQKDFNNNPFSRYLIYILDERVVAYLNFLIMYDKMEIGFIYVDENYRGKGIKL